MKTGKVPQIFDEVALSLRQSRSHRRRARRGESFVLQRIADDITERLRDVNRTFARVLLVAPDDLQIEGLPDDTVRLRPTDHTRMGVPPAGFDLVIALIGPGFANDLVGTLIEARTKLVPDGLFLGAWLGGDTLKELRAATYALDTARRGGISPRIHPTVGHTEAGQLLVRAGLALPVVDFDRFTVRYANLQTLVDDLRDLGLTNSLSQRDRTYPGRDTLPALARHHIRDGDRFPATFEVIYLTAWAPHESQQKPLKPGSATHSLAEALRARETKL